MVAIAILLGLQGALIFFILPLLPSGGTRVPGTPIVVDAES